MYSRILVPIDGTDVAQRGLETACVIAERDKAKLVLVCISDADIPEEIVEAAIHEGIVRVDDYGEFSRSLEFPEVASARAQMTREMVLTRAASAIAKEIAEDAKEFAEDNEIKEVLTLVAAGDVVKNILSAARDTSADLIVMGSNNREGLDALFHPSVAEAVRKGAKCPCLILFAG